MRNLMSYRNIIIILEGILFSLMIIFVIISIFDILSLEYYSISEIFQLWSIRLTFIFFILFILSPYITSLFSHLGNKIASNYNKFKFKKSFMKEIQDKEEINIMQLANKYDINHLFIKNFLMDLITQGRIKGELYGDIFRIKYIAKTTDSKEEKIENFKKQFDNFISSHSLIKIKDISKRFQVPKSFVKAYILNLIRKGKLKGFLQGNTYIQSVFSIEEINCPHCGKKIDLNEL